MICQDFIVVLVSVTGEIQKRKTGIPGNGYMEILEILEILPAGLLT